MYAVYTVAAAGATINQILNDFSLILSGTTDPAALSASCNQAATTILTTYDAAGWTIYDVIGGATPTKIIMSAPTLEGGQTKYFEMSISTTTIIPRMWESWNAGTDTGTNGSNNNTYGLLLAATANTTYTIYANPRCIWIWKNTGTSIIGITEFDRTKWPSQSVANGFIPACHISTSVSLTNYGSSGSIGANFSRCYTRDGLLSSGANGNGSISVYSPFGSLNSYIANVISNTQWIYNWRNSSNQEVALLLDIGICGSLAIASFVDGGEISTLTKVYYTRSGAAGDEFTHNGMTYIYLGGPGGNNYGGFTVPKG
jgi:hypothetical protein